MSRKLILGLVLVLTLGTVAGQPVNITDSSGLDFELAGGEERGFWVEFETGEAFSSSSVLEARLTVSNGDIDVVEGQDRVTGEEFSLSGESPVVRCESEAGGKNYSVHTCQFDESEVLEDDVNNVSFDLESDPRLMPADYGFEFDLRSNASADVEDSAEVEVGEKGANVSLDAGNSGIELNISASKDSKADVEAYSSMPVEEPEETPVMVSAVSVETEDEARGNITFEHDSDLADVSVYYLDGGEWTTQGVEVLERGNDYVKAEVPHFSTYAAYGTDPDYDDTQEQPDTSQSAIEPVASPAGPDTLDEETSGQETDDQQTDDSQQDTGQENQTETGQEDEGENDGQEQQPSEPATDTPTGLFTAEPSNVAGIAAFLVLVAAALLQYTGRVDFREVPGRIRG